VYNMELLKKKAQGKHFEMCFMYENSVPNEDAFTVIDMYLFQSVFTQLFSPFVSVFRKIGKTRSNDTTDYCILLCNSNSSTCSCNFDLHVKKSKDKWILQSCKSTRAESVIA